MVACKLLLHRSIYFSLLFFIFYVVTITATTATVGEETKTKMQKRHSIGLKRKKNIFYRKATS